jgi:hypothetical protein
MANFRCTGKLQITEKTEHTQDISQGESRNLNEIYIKCLVLDGCYHHLNVIILPFTPQKSFSETFGNIPQV